MPNNLITKDKIKELAAKAAGLDKPDGNPRLKQVMNRLLADLFTAMDDLDISMDEFWAAVAYIGQSAKANELGLLVPGVAIEHFLDLRLDEAERLAGLSGGTPRTIEGPLYVAGAPRVKAEARLDDGTDDGEPLFVQGQVKDQSGNPVPGAQVEVWHANTMGFYSFFGPPQSPFNLRRTIETDDQGRYKFWSIMPSGYGCPPGSHTEAILHKMGRHGMRPAHVHFFVTAGGYRHLTAFANEEVSKSCCHKRHSGINHHGIGHARVAQRPNPSNHAKRRKTGNGQRRPAQPSDNLQGFAALRSEEEKHDGAS